MPKIFKCSICGKEVSRRKSYALIDGTRACREHPEAKRDYEKLEEKRKQQKVAEKKKEERKQNRHEPIPLQPICWTCGTTGIMERDAAVKWLIASEKIQLHPTRSKYDIAAIRKEAGLENVTILTVFPVKENQMKHVLKRTKFLMRPIVESSGMTCICDKCNLQLKLTRKLQLPEGMTATEMFETSMALGTIMKPVFREIAEQQIKLEAIKN